MLNWRTEEVMSLFRGIIRRGLSEWTNEWSVCLCSKAVAVVSYLKEFFFCLPQFSYNTNFNSSIRLAAVSEYPCEIRKSKFSNLWSLNLRNMLNAESIRIRITIKVKFLFNEITCRRIIYHLKRDLWTQWHFSVNISSIIVDHLLKFWCICRIQIYI